MTKVTELRRHGKGSKYDGSHTFRVGNKQGQRSQVNTAALISLAQISTMAVWNGEESLLTNGGGKCQAWHSMPTLPGSYMG